MAFHYNCVTALVGGTIPGSKKYHNMNYTPYKHNTTMEDMDDMNIVLSRPLVFKSPNPLSRSSRFSNGGLDYCCVFILVTPPPSQSVTCSLSTCF